MKTKFPSENGFAPSPIVREGWGELKLKI